MRILTLEKIAKIQADRTVTYARVVVNYCTQENDPNCVRIIGGGNLIDYRDKLTTRKLQPNHYQDYVEQRHQSRRNLL